MNIRRHRLQQLIGGLVCILVYLIFSALQTTVCQCPTATNRSPGSTYDNLYAPWPRHVIAFPKARLGNQMFIYAALLGIAARNNMTPVYQDPHGWDRILNDAFGNLIAIKNSQNFKETPGDISYLYEFSYAIYDSRFERLHTIRKLDVEIGSYLQCWKYFRHIESQVRRAFTFKRKHLDAVNAFLHDASVDMRKRNEKVVFVGVHIRRTDMVLVIQDVGDDGYLNRAVQALTEKIWSNVSDCLVFVVCSDDQDWAIANFPPVVDNMTSDVMNRKQSYLAEPLCKPTIVYSRNSSASQDMALLAACNHSIMTVGTFGWWGAWMAGGVTVAYNRFHPHEDKLMENLDDFYPPDWIRLN